MREFSGLSRMVCRRGLRPYDVDAFYYLARTSMVKNERNNRQVRRRPFRPRSLRLEKTSAFDEVMGGGGLSRIEWLEKMR